MDKATSTITRSPSADQDAVVILPLEPEDYESVHDGMVKSMLAADDAIWNQLFPAPLRPPHEVTIARMAALSRLAPQPLTPSTPPVQLKAHSASSPERVLGYANFFLVPPYPQPHPRSAPTAPASAEYLALVAEQDATANLEVRSRRAALHREAELRALGPGSEYDGKGHWHLSLLFTHPSYGRRGIGSALLSAGLAQIDALEPAMPVYLTASPLGESLYLKHGFKPVDTISLVVPSLNRDSTATSLIEYPAMVRPARV